MTTTPKSQGAAIDQAGAPAGLTPVEIDAKLYASLKHVGGALCDVVPFREVKTFADHFAELLLAAPAGAQQADETPTLKDSIAEAFHYPACWDTAAYPTLADALSAVYDSFKCSECTPAPVAAQQAGDDAARDAATLAHGHRDDYYLMANARRLLGNRGAHKTNWSVAADLFATGSNSAIQICTDAGIDPYGFRVERASQANKAGLDGDNHA